MTRDNVYLQSSRLFHLCLNLCYKNHHENEISLDVFTLCVSLKTMTTYMKISARRILPTNHNFQQFSAHFIQKLYNSTIPQSIALNTSNFHISISCKILPMKSTRIQYKNTFFLNPLDERFHIRKPLKSNLKVNHLLPKIDFFPAAF